ncbi:MAG TPA: ESX secretion-associated protein EspG [Amycolatopsis sp.]|nr:ESX secretion-associated protein EspG [Amycolatopsis sp.]
MTAQEFFTPLTFDFLWEAAGLGEVPYPLRARSHGATEDERAALRQRANVELKARGLRDQAGRLQPHIEEWFVLLSRPSISVDALHIPEFQKSPIGVLAASDGTDAVIAIQDTDGVWLRPAFAEGLVSAVIDLLPPGGRGSEASITLPVEEALRVSPSRVPVPAGEAAPEPGRRRRTPLSERVTDPREAYARLIGQPRLRGGQLVANSRDDLGGRQRSPVLAWFDTASGRYLSLSRSGSDGRDWITVAPADAMTLRSRLGEMVATVSPGNPWS